MSADAFPVMRSNPLQNITISPSATNAGPKLNRAHRRELARLARRKARKGKKR